MTVAAAEVAVVVEQKTLQGQAVDVVAAADVAVVVEQATAVAQRTVCQKKSFGNFARKAN